ncbi:hypothetical protein, conserved [Angomonas deanei]|uniref:Uncharacterized protein n=1 Tax=Angomonas deanei TaxID=59799 RepID=A0A7G2CJS4_9TRYP|nr:hypothetical protein, conserved [Angomonas deanei]
MMEFVSSLYAPLVQRCLLSFFAQEKTINFNAQVHLSRQVVLNILNVLALCGSKAIAEEVEEVYRWALGDMFAHSPHAASATTEPTPSTSLISPLNSTRDVSRARMFRSSRMVFTHNSILSAIISLEYKVESGDVECWCQLASIIGHILDLPLSDYEQEIGVRFPTPDFGDRSRTEIEAMLNTVVPAFASYENEKAFRLMGTVVSGFPSLTTSVVKALCRNSRFFAYLLENCEIHPQALNFILVVSAPFCSNGHIIALLKARLANDSTQVDIDKFKHITFASEYVATMEPATKNNYSANTVKKSPSYMEEKLPRALEEMEANCIWMDYCCMHFDAFLLETQKKKFWFPRTASSVCLSASGVLENPSESASAAGVSI